jgi:hypothetical protein
MKAETDPLTDDEWLLRIVWHARFRTNKTPTISPDAFAPRGPKTRNPDWTGISLYRLACLASPADVLANMPADKRLLNGIVGIRASDLSRLGLSVVPDPEPPGPSGEPPIPGHVVVPELRWEAYDNSPTTLDPILDALATTASQPGYTFLQTAG